MAYDNASMVDMTTMDYPFYHHTIPQLQRLSYLLDKVQENTMSYQAEGAFNNKMYLWLFKIVIIVGAIKDIAGLIISNNDIANSETQKYALLGTSIIGIIIVSINVISGAYGYQVKKQQYSIAVEQFDLLEDRIRFEMINPDEDFNKFCQQLETDIEAIKTQCKFQPSLENKARYRKRSNRPDGIMISQPPLVSATTRHKNNHNHNNHNNHTSNIQYTTNNTSSPTNYGTFNYENRLGNDNNTIDAVQTENNTANMIHNIIRPIKGQIKPISVVNQPKQNRHVIHTYPNRSIIMEPDENRDLLEFSEPVTNTTIHISDNTESIKEHLDSSSSLIGTSNIYHVNNDDDICTLSDNEV